MIDWEARDMADAMRNRFAYWWICYRDVEPNFCDFYWGA